MKIALSRRTTRTFGGGNPRETNTNNQKPKTLGGLGRVVKEAPAARAKWAGNVQERGRRTGAKNDYGAPCARSTVRCGPFGVGTVRAP